MKTILMIGDSWAVPNYFGSPGVDPEYHTEFLLRSYGYKVYNCGLNGGSNLFSVVRANDFLKGMPIAHPSQHPEYPESVIDEIDEKIDWVVWFHTELFRDHDPKGLYLEEAQISCARTIYSQIAEFIKSLDCKVAIIGGQSIVRKEIYDYINPDFIIEDWRSEIVDKKLPPVYTLRSPEWVEMLADDKDVKNKILDDHITVLNAMRQSIHFPDRCHPGIEPHRKLSETLHKLFQGEVAQTVRAMDS